jgi:hypothetical protein
MHWFLLAHTSIIISDTGSIHSNTVSAPTAANAAAARELL